MCIYFKRSFFRSQGYIFNLTIMYKKLTTSTMLKINLFLLEKKSFDILVLN